MSSTPLNASDIFSHSDDLACLQSLSNPIKFEGYTFFGILIALIILGLFIYRKKINFKKYILSQFILFLIFSSTFLSSGVSFGGGCSGGGGSPQRIFSEIWSFFPDQFVPIYFDRIVWFLHIFEIIK